MELEDPSFVIPTLEEAIELNPLTVEHDTTLLQVIAQMSLVLGSRCDVENLSAPDLANNKMSKGRSSCVLVMEGRKLRGIFTERDIVHLTAQEISLETVTIGEVMISPVITLPRSSCNNIFGPLFLFRRYKIRHLPIVDDNDQLFGLISTESIRHILRPSNLLKLRRVSDVMISPVIHTNLTTPVLKIAQLMSKHRVSCVIITDCSNSDFSRPVGIITERDIIKFQTLKLNLDVLIAHEVMSSPLFLLRPEDSLKTAYQEMQQRRVQRLVVSWNWGKNMAIVTRTSLLRIFDPTEMFSIIETLQEKVKQLTIEQSNALSFDVNQPVESSRKLYQEEKIDKENVNIYIQSETNEKNN
jgi:CBS domain-containing protein